MGALPGETAVRGANGSSVSDTNDPGKLDLHSLLLKPELFYLQIMDDNWGHRPTRSAVLENYA